MNLFTLLAVFVVLALGVGTLAGAIGILWFGRKKSWKARGMMLVGSCIPLTLGIAALGWLFGPADLTDPEDLRRAYELEFAEAPTPDVWQIQCRQNVVGDSGSAWLCFHASPATVDRLLRRFRPSDRFHFGDVSGGANTPSWWQPETANLVMFYRAENWSSDFQASEAVLAHDAAKGVVYFHHTGAD